ncbi:MAG: hypothetical protein ACQSGP_31470, partial [Frankia sp.]
PGGLERLDFVELPDGDVLLVHELGAARVAPSRGLVWQVTFDHLGVLFDRIDREFAWFEDEYSRYGFRLDDGAAVVM